MYEAGYLQCHLAQYIIRKALECPGWTRRETLEAALENEWDGALGRMLSPHDLRGNNVRHHSSVDISLTVGLNQEPVIQGLLRKYRDDVKEQLHLMDMELVQVDFTLINAFIDTAPAYFARPRPALRVMPTVDRLARHWFRTKWEVLGSAEDTDSFQLEPEEEHKVEELFSYDPSDLLHEDAEFSEKMEPPPRSCYPCEEGITQRFLQMTCGNAIYKAQDIVRVHGTNPSGASEVWSVLATCNIALR